MEKAALKREKASSSLNFLQIQIIIIIMMRNSLIKLCAHMSKAKPKQDWEYVAEIHNHLKGGEYNAAINSLIHSHLEGKVLDMQTYRNMHSRMLELKVSTTYHQLLYKLYRENFKPHNLMVDWMNYLTKSQDTKTQQILHQDYKTLNIQVPKTEIEEEQTKEQPAQPKASIQVEKPEQQKVKASVKEVKQPEQDDGQRIGGDIKHSLQPEQIRRIIEALLGHYSKVVVHDVQVLCENYLNDEEYDGEEYDQQDNNEEDKDEELLDSMTTSISKIKIGRIQIFDNRNPIQDPENNNNNS